MANPICANDCNDKLAPVQFSACNPEVNASEIIRIFVAAANAAPLTDWKTAQAWTERISNTDVASQDAIRVLTVIADKPAAADVVKDLSNGRKKTLRKDHTVNYTIDETNDANYEFMRKLECSGRVKFWYETAGGKLYGGDEGIKGDITGNIVNNSGADEIETIQGTITWKAKFSPERVNSPIFENDFLVTEPNV